MLVDAERGFLVWNAGYDGVLGDIFALQDEIANTVVAKLRDTVPTELPGLGRADRTLELVVHHNVVEFAHRR